MAAQGEAALAVRPGDRSARRSLDSLRKLDSAPRREEPGHVRGRGRQRPHHRPLAARSRSFAPPAAAPLWFTRRGERSGSGSPSSSPTSPRPWPRAAARPRPRRCARCGARPPPGGSSAAAKRASAASALRKGDIVVVEAGEIIPGDGDVIEGIASVDESAITGESAPGHPREPAATAPRSPAAPGCSRTGSSSRITADPGESFLDRMIALVEGAARQKTPNEIALHILLVGLTLVFLFACVTLVPLARLLGRSRLSATAIVALLVCLIPTTIGGLLSAIGIAGMDRLLRKNVHRDERPRGRGGGRRGHAAPRQDRHHHARQPDGDRAPPAPRRRRGGRSPTPRSSRASPTRRRRAAPSSSSRRNATDCADARFASRGTTSSPSPPQTRMSGCDLARRGRSARARSTPSRSTSRSVGGSVPAELSDGRCAASATPAARRSPSPTAPACSASSTSRTS